MFVVDAKGRKIIITDEVSRKVTEIKEGESLTRKFLDGTIDKYDCVLKLVDVDVIDPATQTKTGKKETRAFGQRVGNPHWLIEFKEEEYLIG